jgi:hypothetical protein
MLRSYHWALLAAVLLIHPGCDSFPSAVDSPISPEAGPNGGGAVSIEHAFFNLHSSTLAEDNWPLAYTKYELFVCAANMSNEDLQKVRQDIPGVKLIAAMNAQMVPLGTYNGAYYEALTAAFDTLLCIQDLFTQTTVQINEGLSDYVMRQESADVLAAFHRDVTMQVEWDGIYIDQFRKSYSARKKERLRDVTNFFDIDNDGDYDTEEDIDASIALWKPYFTEQLRFFLGDEAIIVGNTGAGAVLDPSINGMTMENVGVWFTVEEAREYVLNQLDVSPYPFVGIAWAIMPASRAPSLELVIDLDFMYLGDVGLRDDNANGQGF